MIDWSSSPFPQFPTISNMFPLHVLRAEFFKLYGFDPFFPLQIDEDHTEIAFLVPETLYESPTFTYGSVKLLLHFLAPMEWGIQQSTWHKFNSYSEGDRTHLLGPHLHLQLKLQKYACTFPQEPLNMQWNIVGMSYDDVKPPHSANTFNTFHYEAAFPTEYQTTLERLKNRATEAVHALEN